ncbi:Beta-glucuronidase [Hypsizygus marmoreus]|uniref:Beta-glucuronidase n=1 Tax=Hypsizygus marmoreus TaxID=39966 RepID=A0A369J4P5_HYPMA|nr:Beta-glucuronidase [Hypsizygus marmoreus]
MLLSLPLSSLLVAVIVTLPLVASAGKPLNVSFPETPPSSALKNVVDDNFIGISWELSSFDTLWGKTVNTIPHAMQNYLHNIAVRISKPLRIRVGGNGMDGSTYVPNLSTFLEFIDPDAYFNDIPVKFGPIMFDVMNAMSDKIGPMQFTIGLSMRTPHDTKNVVALAVAAEKKFGDRLDSFLLGNEPDLYAGHGERWEYDIDTYVSEIGSTLDDLRDAGVLEKKVIGGPTICCGWNLSSILDAGLDQYPYKYYTIQRYPQHNCGGPTEKNTNISYFLDHTNVASYLNWQQEGMAKAQALDVPVLLTEYNTVACGGSNISSTFAATLWAIDVGLKAASVNYSAIYLHTREHDITYNLFDPPTPETSTESGWITGSPYYAALFLAEVTDSAGSVIIDLNLNNSNTYAGGTVSAYGVYDNGGATRGKLALLNFADDGSVPQIYRVPAGVAESLSIRVLKAPEVTERRNISWAGQTVGDNGDLQGEQETIELRCAEGCEIEVPGPGAALVFLGNSPYFTGNSTIAGVGGYLSGATLANPAWTFLVTSVIGVLVAALQ